MSLENSRAGAAMPPTPPLDAEAELEATARPSDLAESFAMFSDDIGWGYAGRRVRKAPTLDEIDNPHRTGDE